VSLGLAFGSDFVDPSIRTPDEAQAVLNVTVLAALPREQHLLSAGKADHSAEIANSAQAGH
jgi:hypothetical protein